MFSRRFLKMGLQHSRSKGGDADIAARGLPYDHGSRYLSIVIGGVRIMKQRFAVIVGLVVIASMLLSACGATAAAPEACKTDALGCAVIKAGQTIKIGMGAPMTGDNAAFGQDISQGAKIAMTDGGQFNGFSFELVAQDDGGTAEGGAAVANKFVSDPTIVAIEGHIFSGATKAAIPIYEKAGLPMMSPSATNPDLTKQGSKVFNRLVFTDAF